MYSRSYIPPKRYIQTSWAGSVILNKVVFHKKIPPKLLEENGWMLLSDKVNKYKVKRRNRIEFHYCMHGYQNDNRMKRKKYKIAKQCA
jgi:hypothetical protein